MRVRVGQRPINDWGESTAAIEPFQRAAQSYWSRHHNETKRRTSIEPPLRSTQRLFITTPLHCAVMAPTTVTRTMIDDEARTYMTWRS